MIALLTRVYPCHIRIKTCYLRETGAPSQTALQAYREYLDRYTPTPLGKTPALTASLIFYIKKFARHSPPAPARLPGAIQTPAIGLLIFVSGPSDQQQPQTIRRAVETMT